MVRLRKFVTLDGEVTAEEEWTLKPTDRCFYCDQYLIASHNQPCSIGFDGLHDYVTLTNKVA